MAPLPQCAHSPSSTVDSDDEELAGDADFSDDFPFRAVERGTGDDVLDITRPGVALTLDDFAREDDAFEIEDVEVVIFKFLSGVE